jgi:putative flippase GtrA
MRSGLPGHATTLTRATICSIAATAVEFALLPVLVHVFGVAHWVSYGLVQFVANAITFLSYKYWAFEAGDRGSMQAQYARQLLVFAGSFVLNVAIPSFLSYRLKVEPVLAFAISTAIVYLGWNYPGNRYFVFRR